MGLLKINFDVAFEDGEAVTGVLLQDHQEYILKAWVNRFASENPYCVEAKAAIQAL